MSEVAGKTLYFTLEEYQSRLRLLRERMSQQGLDVMLVHTPENIYYLTGYQTPGYYTYQCLIVPIEEEPIIFTRFLEETNVRDLSWIDNRLYYLDTQIPAAETGRILNEHGFGDKTIGIEEASWFLTMTEFRAIEAGVPQARFQDASGTVEQLRVIKSPQEIEYIRQAAQVCEAGMRRAIEVAAEGKTENDLAVALLSGSIEAGGEYMSLPPFVASGPRGALGHATWSGRALQRGDAVFLEHSGTIHRYSASLIRTIAIGQANDRAKQLDEAVRAGLRAAIETAGPGVPAAEVDRACRGTIKQLGFGDLFRHRTGYSIGVNFPPDWGEGHILSLKDSETRPLEPGMTFHIVPILIDYGHAGVGCSETILITEDGCEEITTFPEPMQVV